MFSLGIILARAGSKGLPDKCVRPLLGRPLIDYTIDHALAAARLDALVLTTDSLPAADAARRRGVEVIDRPAELASDAARVDAAARHAVEAWEGRHGRRIEAAVLLYGNIPVRAAGLIDRVLAHLERSGSDSVRTVAPVGRHHPDWLHRLNGDRMTQFRINGIHRRQDLEPLYYHDGAAVAVTRAALFAAADAAADGQAFLGQDRRAIVQGRDDAVDVDDAVDLCVAEALLRRAAAADGGRDSTATVTIGGRTVGAGRPVYVVAEAGVNHDGLLAQALRLVDAAREAGADAVKFQVFRAAELTTCDADLADYQRAAGAASQRAMLARLELSDADLARLSEHCRACGIDFIVTPFGVADIERVRRLRPSALKIASTDINHVALLCAARRTGLPLIVSTGAATEEEIAAAVARHGDRPPPVAQERGANALPGMVLLHCVSRYPTPIEALNLAAIAALRERFGVPAGLSDHTLSLSTGGFAVAAGACVLEKHFTLDREAAGPDHAMSLDPAELREYVARARECQAAIGDGAIGMSEIETEVRTIARRSLVAARDLPAGAALAPDMLAAKRPAGGIAPDQLDALLGRTLAVAVRRDERIAWEMLR